MVVINGTTREGDSLVQAYLELKGKLIEWEKELKADADNEEKAGRTARRVAGEIGQYIESQHGIKKIASLVDTFRAYAGKWQ